MIKLLFLLLIVTVIFIIYVEYTVGGILIRDNSLNEKTLNLSSLFHFLVNPLHKTFLWNFKTLDINYPFVILVTIFIYKFDFFKKIFYKWIY